MTTEEFDTALSDLETRVDRLRALYENWFRGYEKTEPGVARKDVERRVYGLRKELPRNTALRFRYHQLYQRYTTLATYWQRTARQIEEGTYRRQLQRIKRRRDDDEARTLAPPPKGPEESSSPPPAFELNLDETLDVRNLLDDFDLDQVASALDVSLPAAAPAASKASVDLAAHVRTTGRLPVPASLGAIASAATAKPAEPRPSIPQAPAAAEPVAGPAKRFARPSVDASAAPVGIGRGSQRPPPPMAPANDVTPQQARPAAPKPPAIPVAARSPSTGTMPMPPPPPAAAARPGGTGTFGMPPTGRIPAPPPRPAQAPVASAAATPSLAAPAAAVPRPAPPARPAMPTPDGPAARPPSPTAGAPAARPSLPTAGSPAVRPAAPTSGGPAARPAATSPQPTNGSPAVAARPPQQSGLTARADGNLDDQRMRRIYEEYSAAKRKNNEADVRFETLAGSIQKMLPDLHKRHAGKQIDFEVVLKDGRVGLKPKAT